MINSAIILANGNFPKREEALQAMLQSKLIVCCDGAFAKLAASGLFNRASSIPPIHVVGDGDSLTSEMRRQPLKATFVDSYRDQETNDLTKAVKYALQLGITHAIILGATGLREDHTLGNISLLTQYAQLTAIDGNALHIRLYSDFGFFTPLVNGSGDARELTATLSSFPRQQVSLFAMTHGMAVSADGLKYPLQHRTLGNLWEATLNEALGDKFSVTLEGKGTLLVYQTHHAK